MGWSFEMGLYTGVEVERKMVSNGIISGESA